MERDRFGAVKAYAIERIKPDAAHVDRNGVLPTDQFMECGQLGMLGLLINRAYGGVDASHLLYYAVIYEIAKHCRSHALTLLSHNACAQIITLFGDDDQKQRYLPRLAGGKCVGAVCLTEPNAGSDLGAVQTSAVEHEDGYVLNGSKQFITNGSKSHILVVLARTSTDKGVFDKSLLIAEKSFKGITIGRRERKLGFRGADTSELFFNNVPIPKNNIIGKKGQGMMQVLESMDTTRVATAAMILGVSKAVSRYMKRHKDIVRKNNTDIIDVYMADIITSIELSETYIRWIAEKQKNGGKITKEAALIKRYTSDEAVMNTSRAMQLFGPPGCFKESELELLFRDARLGKIIEGTNEIQSYIIHSHM